jgi:hypothetical protein
LSLVRLYILDDQRRPVRAADLTQWGQWIKRRESDLCVGADTIGRCRVSTVFLAADAKLHSTDEPLLFETRIVGGPLPEDRIKYRTWEEAEAGHREMVRRVETAVRQSAAPRVS